MFQKIKIREVLCNKNPLLPLLVYPNKGFNNLKATQTLAPTVNTGQHPFDTNAPENDTVEHLNQKPNRALFCLN